MQTSPLSGWIPESPLFMFNFQKTNKMKNLTLEQIEKLIWAKKDAQERLSFMKNRSAAKELWNDLQSEINTLREIAKSKMNLSTL